MITEVIGRKREREILARALNTPEAELIAVIGRRRVGKTFLVTRTYQNRIAFEITGVLDGALTTQLHNFADQLSRFAQTPLPLKQPANWLEAFQLLRDYLESLPAASLEEKRVLFFDEVPWLAGQKSGFLEAFGYFWNSWASRQPLVVVICGSAASWMIRRVVNNRGGLHNRITKRIHLAPFTLSETEAYLHSRDVYLDRYQIVQLYMVMGGIPHYLKEIDGGKSAVQNIDAICFTQNGLLSDEFERLYPSLFANAEQHVAIIRALSQKKHGMTRKQLLAATQLPNGGGFTKVLEELNQSGFISEYYPFGKRKKEKLYRLTDEYSLFYLQFIERHRYQGSNPWQHLSQTPVYRAWSGYAFESICLKHIAEIKQALGIAGVYAVAASFYQKGDNAEEGAQIDLVLDRNDHIVDLFEIKFHQQLYALSKEDAEQLRRRAWAFQQSTNTRKQLRWVFITTFGLTHNQHSLGLVANVLTMDDLFKD